MANIHVNTDNDFQEAARPLIKYLCDNHTPHTRVSVTPTEAVLSDDSISTGLILDYLKD